MTTAVLSRDELRGLFLFANLTDAQLDWIAGYGEIAEFPAGSVVAAEGDPAKCFYVLLHGTLSMSRLVHGDDVEITRSDQRGAYGGAVRFFTDDIEEQTYQSTLRAVTPCQFLALPAAKFSGQLAEWYPMAVHLLRGMVTGHRNTDAVIGQRERLLALGKLSAGLTHELNNPAAAAGRAAVALRDRFAGMRHKLALLASSELDGTQLKRLTGLQEEVVERVGSAPKLSALEASDREDELGDWLDEHGIPGGWELAPVFVAGGLQVDDLDRVAAAVDDGFLEGALRWLTYTVDTESLLVEIADSTNRISALVGAAKQYSQLDRAPHQFVDVHEGLDSTLIMLSRKIGEDVEVVKAYGHELPAIPAYPAELNQVWTNLIVNATEAMHRAGTLTLRSGLDGERLLVEVCDTGPGVPDELRQRIFEPFFTTKPVGEGTGLGLDVSWRIVVNRHGGDLRVVSEPGDTRFQVWLPLQDPDTPPGDRMSR